VFDEIASSILLPEKTLNRTFAEISLESSNNLWLSSYIYYYENIMVKKSKSNKSKLKPTKKPREIGGVDGPDPTRYGDWEKKGICHDF
jgi:hypothetical protein